MAHDADGEVWRVVAASQATQPPVTFAALEQGRDAALRRPDDGVHAALLSQCGWFIHWFEGPDEGVRPRLKALDHEELHHPPRLLHASRGPRFLLTRWSMMHNPSTEPAALFARRVEQLHASRERGIQFPPTSVVRRLVAPLRVLGPRPADHPESFWRIGVCSADDGRCFDFVHWLAASRQGMEQTRRVAGEHDSDSASDYVEFLEGTQACRVIAVSRAGLQHGLRRAFLPDWPFLVLLFGDELKRNTALLERVRDACRGLAAVPQLLGVAPTAAMHVRMGVMCRLAGLPYTQMAVLDARDHEAIWQDVAARLRAGQVGVTHWETTHPGMRVSESL